MNREKQIQLQLDYELYAVRGENENNVNDTKSHTKSAPSSQRENRPTTSIYEF